MGKRLLTSVLSAVLILTSIPATGLQVYANEADTVVVSEVENEVETEVSVEELGETMSTEESEEIADESVDASEESLSETESEESVAVETVTEESGTEVEETLSEGVEETETATESFNDETVGKELSLSSLTVISGEDIIASGSYENITWTIDKNGHLKVEGTGEFAKSEENVPLRYAPWVGTYADQIISAEVNVTGMTDASDMFKGCTKLESIDLTDFDTSQVTNMSMMFANCYALKTLDLRCLDTSSVTDMSYMFSFCQNLSSLNVSGFNTANVVNMSWMFDMCFELTSLDVSGFDTSKVTNMQGMFEGCKKITALDVSKFDTSNVADMSQMFNGMEKVYELNVSGFDTSKVTNMDGMFYGCNSIMTLDVSGFNTTNVTDMSDMFYGCTSLTQIDISSWDINKVTDFSWMFAYCRSLKNVDMSMLEADSAEKLLGMFSSCDELEEVKLPSMMSGSIKDARQIVEQCPKIQELDFSRVNCEGNTVEGELFGSGCTNLSKIYLPYNVSIWMGFCIWGDDEWFLADGTEIDSVPLNLNYSVVAMKNQVPKVPEPYIKVTKNKTSYYCGEELNIDDIEIQCFNKLGGIENVKTGYTTNVEEIDIYVPGKKELIVTYSDLAAKVIIEFTYPLEADTVEISILKTEYTYNATEQKPAVQVTSTSGTVLTPGEDYSVSYENNVNVTTEAKVIITGKNNYRGTLEKSFTIVPTALTITAKNTFITLGSKLPTNEDFIYRISGLCGTDSLITEPSFACPVTDMNIVGTYPITPYGADAGINYVITYVDGTLKVQEEAIVYTVTFDTMGHGESVSSIRGVKAGNIITEPQQPQEEGWIFGGWYKDKACTKVWNFETDTVQGDTTLYACWMIAVEEGEYSFCVQDIRDQSYTGNTLKPSVRIYAADGSTLLKSGKDYTIKYYNNTLADTEEERGLGGDNSTGIEGEGGFTKNLPYVVITGKGDYSGSVYRNFHIIPAIIGDGLNTAEGITLKYAEQLTVNDKKDQKPLTSLKYKKSMKAGTDYTVTLTALDAKDANGNPLTEGLTVNVGSAPVIPKGYSGHFAMLVEGTGNYTGSIEKAIYVSDKNHLIKNATISLGKNQKKVVYKDGENITLTSGWYDTKAKKYYKVNADGSLYEEAEKNANDIFTVKVGSTYLRYGIDYIVSYKNNNAVGKANLVISGTGDYSGSKTTGFTITGQAFNTSNIVVGSEFKTSVTYTGRPQTQNNVTLTTKAGDSLEYGVHYTISYKNNLKKGTASMKLTAKPESGYTGSITKTFKITAPTLTDAVDVVTVYGEDSIETSGNGTVLIGDVVYRRNGSRPVDRIQLVNKETGDVLKAGTDYSVSYANNKKVTTESIAVDKLPLMTLKGKGNYTGSIKITFRILEASFEEDENVTIKTSAVKYNAGKKDNYQYKPSIKVLDATIPLSLNKDYKLEYINCMQPQVKEYLTALADGSKTAEELQDMKPKAVITVMEGKGYVKGQSRTIDLPIYLTKFTTSNLYVVISEENTTYTGDQLTPSVDVYYGDAKAVKAAKSALEVDEVVLTDESGTFKLTKLSVGDDYSISYGANIKAGKNKGSVTVTGNNLYGGIVTTKFTIKSRNVY